MTVGDAMSLPASVRHVRCANPGPMTLTGTNSYVIRLAGRKVSGGSVQKPDSPDVAVVDPGPALTPDHLTHREALVQTVRDFSRNGRVAVLLTHHHDDHAGGVDEFVAALRGQSLQVSMHGAGLGEWPVTMGPLTVLPTPGHTRDSVCFLLEADGVSVLFSGDTLLGGSSSFIAHPDGDLTDYLASLAALAEVAAAGRLVLAPGHGDVGGDAGAVVAQYREHRKERLAQVEAALEAAGPTAGADDVIAAVYGDIGLQLRPAVEAIVQAQLKHLRR